MKHLAIDIGNVICDVNFLPFVRELSRALNVHTSDVDYFLSRTQKLHDLGLTVIGDELRDHFKIKSSVIVESLIKEWNRAIIPNYYTITFLKDLIAPKDGSEPTKVALLSNIGYEHSSLMEDVLSKQVYNSSIKFFSCNVGARKPSFIFYKTFLDMYPEFKGCIYLDDRMENIETGKVFGFNSVHFALDGFNSEDDLTNRLAEIKQLIF